MFFSSKKYQLCTIFSGTKNALPPIDHFFTSQGYPNWMALAVVWIYLGNLVNFHQNRIWGKQLIPVACSSHALKKRMKHLLLKTTEFKIFRLGSAFDLPHLVNGLRYSLFEVATVYFLPPDALVIISGYSGLLVQRPSFSLISEYQSLLITNTLLCFNSCTAFVLGIFHPY